MGAVRRHFFFGAMDPRFNKIVQGLTAQQQQRLACLPPEARPNFVHQLQMQRVRMASASASGQQDLKSLQHNTQSTIPPPIAAFQPPTETPKRKRGGGPRKCNNPSCDRIVTKRNFCYKCQKRKERGLPMGPRLPSVQQVLSTSQQFEAPSPAPSSPQLAPLLNVKFEFPHTPQQPSSPMSLEQPVEEKKEKMEMLHSYLLKLAGTEEKANELLHDYIQQQPSSPSPSPLNRPAAFPQSNFSGFAAAQRPQQDFTRYY